MFRDILCSLNKQFNVDIAANGLLLSKGLEKCWLDLEYLRHSQMPLRHSFEWRIRSFPRMVTAHCQEQNSVSNSLETQSLPP